MPMKVAIVCECSGVVRDTFIARGHNAVSIDTKWTSGPHIKTDARKIDYTEFNLVIAHPPCTRLTIAQAWKLKDPLLAKDLKEAIEFFTWCIDIPCERLAVENPIGIMSTQLRPPDQIIQPYQFGENASKSTCLWLRNLPCLKGTKYYPPRIVNGLKRWGNQTDSGQNKLAPSSQRAHDRARTYQGIADAMADQWGALEGELFHGGSESLF